MVRLDAVSPQDAPQSTLLVNADTLPVATPATLPVNADILPVTLPVVNSLLGRLLQVLDHETGMAELLKLLNKKNRLDVRERYIAPAMKFGYIEYTIPSKPNSRLQKYRLTAKGQELRAQMATEGLGTEGNGDSN